MCACIGPYLPQHFSVRPSAQFYFHLVSDLTTNWECTGVWRLEAPTFHMWGMNNASYALAPMIMLAALKGAFSRSNHSLAPFPSSLLLRPITCQVAHHLALLYETGKNLNIR